MNGVVGVDVLKRQYSGEWVLLADPELDGDCRVVGGVLRFHSRARAETDRFAIESGCVTGAVLFLGEPLRDAVFAL